MISHAFHDLIHKGLFIVSDCDIFFVPDEEVDRVRYNPVQHGVLPVSPVELRQLLAHDRDGWIRSNLKRLGF